MNATMGGRRSSRASVPLCALALVLLSSHGGLPCFVGTWSGISSRQPSLGQQHAVGTKEDDAAAEMTAAIYDAWVKEYPLVAKRGDFLGAPASRADMVLRAHALRSGLQLDWSAILEMVETDSMVLFAGSERKVQQAFLQIQMELGSREAALRAIQMQPALLLASTGELRGKGKVLEAFAALSSATRPFYRTLRSAASPVTTSSLLPDVPRGRLVGLPSAMQKEIKRGVDRMNQVLPGGVVPWSLACFLALTFYSEVAGAAHVQSAPQGVLPSLLRQVLSN